MHVTSCSFFHAIVQHRFLLYSFLICISFTRTSFIPRVQFLNLFFSALFFCTSSIPPIQFLQHSIIFFFFFSLAYTNKSFSTKKMQIKFSSLNVNGFNKSADKLAHFITHNNIHFTCIQETHTIQHQQLSHFSHQYNFLVFQNTDHSLTPQISHRHGTFVIIITKQIHLNTQMISPHIVLPNYI